MSSKFWLISLLFPLFCISQTTLTGKVIYKITQEPVETAAIYFDNTTVGTTSNAKGEFTIQFTDAIQSNLVISYLGYEIVIISDYRSKNNITVELVEANIALSAVHLDYDDGLTRRQKLRMFRKEFLGTSEFAKSCKILNEDDLILKYDKQNKALYASSNVPIKVQNRALKYLVAYNIIDFEATYRYANLETKVFTVNAVTYMGTSFYTDLKNATKKKAIKNRERVYKGSVQHFMRSLYNKNLKDEGYWVFYKRFRVDEWSHFKIEDVKGSNFKSITLDKKVTILYNNKAQSEVQLEVEKVFVDVYGNYTPILGVFFSGAMGDQRVGDTLPLDYGLD